jgi:purine-binding chemotaxis protein CheW
MIMQTNSALDTARLNDVVVFKLGEQDYCIDIGVVREIRGWSPTTVLPHAPVFVKGVINLRGSVVAVVDLAARLGLGTMTPTARHVIIIVMLGSQFIGLLADVVADIIAIKDVDLKPVPEVASESVTQFITNVITLDDGRILRKIDLTQVVPRSGTGDRP